MNLTMFTDYSLRTLIYVAMKPDDRLSNIQEIADVYGISANHLMKSVHKLGKLGLIQTIRGRNGGFRLAKPAEEINIGWVVREMEENWNIVECFDEQNGACVLSPSCRLKNVLGEALKAYLAVLDKYTLADLVVNRQALGVLLGMRETSC
ncbi:Rrf2 family transcriptional regulator [Alicyclobacillus fastidiosus]|uniref:HTH-type transcriptional regulator NsrR n=1 Tax=Alicyclobacillus fastidiosus TaxID=392011 RepID=A0ABY6ZL08_9BACL|nr:Rrf2 family transcriptional regulator [Alicyclobacillus fastidiosus]WAH43278.1 Rrf2 family transcriptional regulator [Alicyclobacillus fastidiosus]GMA65325.1 HTH-type transcriptional regulator NsrR [Alicyclobacillus fastidiosus]